MPDEVPPVGLAGALKKHGGKAAAGGLSLTALLGALQLYNDVREQIHSNKEVIRSNEVLYVTVQDWINMERSQDEKNDAKIMALHREIDQLKAKQVAFEEYGDSGIPTISVSRVPVKINLATNGSYSIGAPTH